MGVNLGSKGSEQITVLRVDDQLVDLVAWDVADEGLPYFFDAPKMFGRLERERS